MVDFEDGLKKIDEIVLKHKMCSIYDFINKSYFEFHCWSHNYDYELDKLIEELKGE